MGINNESADTRECTTIIAFYNGNRSRNVRVIANIALDLIKYRCRKGRAGGGRWSRVYTLTFAPIVHYCALLHLRITRSLGLKGLSKRGRLLILHGTYVSFDRVSMPHLPSVCYLHNPFHRYINTKSWSSMSFSNIYNIIYQNSFTPNKFINARGFTVSI